MTAGAFAAALLLALTGCAGIVSMDPAEDAANPECARVIVALPEMVATLKIRETDAQATGAWGEPALVLLRCGVPVPDPTSQLACVEVRGVHWLRDASEEPVTVFTTYGRDPAIEVVVDGTYVSGGTALTDLANAVSQIPAERECISLDEVFEGRTG